jgi:hypothetical protein
MDDVIDFLKSFLFAENAAEIKSLGAKFPEFIKDIDLSAFESRAQINIKELVLSSVKNYCDNPTDNYITIQQLITQLQNLVD